MRGRNKLKTWWRWRQLIKETSSESLYHALHGVSHWREYYWRYYERLKKLNK